MVANNIGNLNIKLKNDSQLLKQTQSLFKSPPLHHDKARQRYDSSSSSGKLAVYITDSQTTTKKPNVQVNPVRYSSLRATSGHRNNCTTHSLVSAKHRSSKLKCWTDTLSSPPPKLESTLAREAMQAIMPRSPITRPHFIRSSSS